MRNTLGPHDSYTYAALSSIYMVVVASPYVVPRRDARVVRQHRPVSGSLRLRCSRYCSPRTGLPSRCHRFGPGTSHHPGLHCFAGAPRRRAPALALLDTARWGQRSIARPHCPACGEACLRHFRPLFLFLSLSQPLFGALQLLRDQRFSLRCSSSVGPVHRGYTTVPRRLSRAPSLSTPGHSRKGYTRPCLGWQCSGLALLRCVHR